MNKKYKYTPLSQEDIKILVDKIVEKNPDDNNTYEFSEYEDNTLYVPLGEYIKEMGNYEETIDSSYIHNDYTCTIFNKMYTVRGSSYLKDQSICDEELSNEIIMIEEIILSSNEIKNEILKKIELHKNSILKLEKQLNE